MKKFIITLTLLAATIGTGTAQDKEQKSDRTKDIIEKEGLVVQPKTIEKPKYNYRPLTLSLSEDGQQYVRFIIWHQQWMVTNNLAVPDAKTQVTHMVRRSRFLAYSQLHPKILILTHWGLNNLTPQGMTALGNDGDPPQLFLHDAWTEFKVNDALYIGGGLHYWNGLTRLASQSTLNFMTMDQSRPFMHWHSLGMTDQFARHMGLYFKGDIGRLAYRVSVNNPHRSPLGGGNSFGNVPTSLKYNGVSNNDINGTPVGNSVYQGYFNFYFLDKESSKLPFFVGAYLGTKRVFNVGGGFFAHPKGMFNTVTRAHHNVFHFALDANIDLPIENFGAVSAYASYIRFNYGENFMARWAGTGNGYYVHAGIYEKRTKLMPYASYQLGDYEGLRDNMHAVDAGMSYYMMGNSAKLSLEYHMVSGFPAEGGLNAQGDPMGMKQLRAQAHIFF